MAELMVDPATGRETFRGFSWTTLFWGPIPALYRRDWVGAVMWVAIVLVAAIVGTAAGVVLGYPELLGRVVVFAAAVVWASVYNEGHARRVAGR